MSTKEKIYGIIENMSEEQLNALFIILGGIVRPENSKTKKSARGIFSDSANPELIPLEKEAWAESVKERYIIENENI